jgi:hypothetical protein
MKKSQTSCQSWFISSSFQNDKFGFDSYGAFTLDVKSMLNENLDGILGGTQCQMGDSLMLNEF